MSAGPVHIISVQSIAIKNHSAPENLKESQKTIPEEHLPDDRIRLDGSMFPIGNYKRKAGPRRKKS
jgi:hypothetical protein